MMLLLACARVEYDVADLQLDLAGAIPATAETMRVCVDGQFIHEEGAGNGRIAVPGIWTDRPAVVVVEVSDADGEELGQAGPVTFDAEDVYLTAPFDAADGVACESVDDPAPAGAETWLLGIRFSEEPIGW
jgi:hypothetical protein